MPIRGVHSSSRTVFSQCCNGGADFPFVVSMFLWVSELLLSFKSYKGMYYATIHDVTKFSCLLVPRFPFPVILLRHVHALFEI